MKLLEKESLAPYTTLGLGGPARYFVRIETVDDLAAASQFARAHECPLLVVGGGSNLVVSDSGFPGLVAHINLLGIESVVASDYVTVTAAAGEPWDGLVDFALSRGWAGIECLAGIPGRVGATPIQNVGAYGQEVADTIQRVRVFDTHDGVERILETADCRFAYRQSRFKTEAAGRFVVLSVAYRLHLGAPAPPRFGELASALAGAPLTVERVATAVRRLRAGKGMVLNPDDPDTRSVGSFFMNPIVSSTEADAVAARSAALGVASPLPRHETPEGVKLSAAWLIERAGFPKGWGGANVAVSTKHTLALTHRGGGSTAQLLDMAATIRRGVAERFGVTLHMEPVLVNCQFPD